jgi:uncharacterized membrane protein YbaN (DUF454 family)
LTAGVLCLATGTLGIVCPLLPTVDFYVLAAVCFARGDRRWARWLDGHRVIGPMLRDWHAHRTLPTRVRCIATLSACVTGAWAMHTLPPAGACIALVCAAGLIAWLWTRPGRASAARVCTTCPQSSAHLDHSRSGVRHADIA